MHAKVYQRLRELREGEFGVLERARALVKFQAGRSLMTRSAYLDRPGTPRQRTVETIRLLSATMGRQGVGRGYISFGAGAHRAWLLRGVPVPNREGSHHAVPPLREGPRLGATYAATLPNVDGGTPSSGPRDQRRSLPLHHRVDEDGGRGERINGFYLLLPHNFCGRRRTMRGRGSVARSGVACEHARLRVVRSPLGWWDLGGRARVGDDASATMTSNLVRTFTPCRYTVFVTSAKTHTGRASMFAPS